MSSRAPPSRVGAAQVVKNRGVRSWRSQEGYLLRGSCPCALTAYPARRFPAYLLYVDESGELQDPDDHFVLGGVAVRDSEVRSVTRLMERDVALHLDEHLRNIELHAQHIRKGKGPWRAIPPEVKSGLLESVAATLGGFSAEQGCALFAVVRAPRAVPSADPLERCFEELFLRFTLMLRRVEREHGQEMGLVIADKARYEDTLQPLVQRWQWTSGTRFGRLASLAEVPLFLDSRASRLTQAADIVAHGVYRRYAADDSMIFDKLLPGFDASEGVVHGLVHLVRRYLTCGCPACLSRAAATGKG